MRRNWVEDFWMANKTYELGANVAPPGSVALVHIVPRPVYLAPGESLSSLNLRQFMDRAVDWEATGRHSALITNIGKDVNGEGQGH